MKQWTLLLAILVTASAFDVPATTGLAQATGSLSGTVVDAQGAVLSGVRVDATLESDPTVKGSTVTDSRGRFTILNLPVGTYRVEYAVEGFATGQRRGVMVSTGESNPLRLVLAGGRLEGPGGAAPGERGPTAAPAAEPKPPGQRAKPPAQAAPALPAPPVTPVTPSASPSPAPAANDTSTSGEVATIPVFYATDRERLPGPSPAYGGNRNSTGQLDLGRFDVTVPRDHRMGSVERPGLWTIWQEDPTKHFVIKTRLLQSYDDFYSGIRELVGRSSRKEAFVFIHGFNVDFDDAVYRTAQLAYDLGFDGAPILYSWPSVGKATPIGYTTDAANNDWSSTHLRWFLEDVARRTGATRIHLIAHSMGNKALVNALDHLTPGNARRFSQIVLTAPDIDAQTFVQLAAAVTRNAQMVTLYASSRDRALALSKTLQSYRRAGDTTGGPVMVAGIDTIDVSAIDTDLLGHSYYGSTTTVLSDLFLLLSQGLPPASRPRLHVSGTAPRQFWVFAP